MSSGSQTFNLSNYDVIAFDFDNTLVQYHLNKLLQLHYKYLTNYLMEQKGYKDLETNMNKEDIDFVQRGLFMDFIRGNILKVSANGQIMRATHGSKKLNRDEIISIYGPDMRWKYIDLFMEDKLKMDFCSRKDLISEELHVFLDFTDCVGILLFAKMVDLADSHGNTEGNYKTRMQDIADAFASMYEIGSDFLKTVYPNRETYIYKCEDKVIEWLKVLKKNRKLLLISGSTYPGVKGVSQYACPELEELFDIIICQARKPAFFNGIKPFCSIDREPVELNNVNGAYLFGNWPTLYKQLTKELGRPPKCVYFGDSTIQDIYGVTRNRSSYLEAVAVMEESWAEGLFPDVHPYSEFVKSNFWGSYFKLDGITTLMGDITNRSKLVIPLLKHIVDKPVDHQHTYWIPSTSDEEK